MWIVNGSVFAILLANHNLHHDHNHILGEGPYRQIDLLCKVHEKKTSLCDDSRYQVFPTRKRKVESEKGGGYVSFGF